jgi:hypothetical protein
MQIQVRIDDRDLRRGLQALGPRMGGVLAKSLNRTAFEIRDAEGAEASQSFEFAGPSTRAFMASPRAFVFEGATTSKLQVSLHPREKAERLLADHVFGATVTADERRLKVGDAVAVPVGVKVSSRGRVAPSQTPAGVLRRKKGFIAGKALLGVTGRGKSRTVRVLYALTERFTLPKRFDFFGVARNTAERQFPIKAREEFNKLRV